MIRCMDCRRRYSDLMACDLVIPRAQWLALNPQDGGVLCANCLLRRAVALPGTVNITGRITTGDDSLEIYQQASMGASELKTEAQPVLQGPTREEVARIIDPGAFDESIKKVARAHWREHAYAKADSILALLKPTSPWRPIESAPRDGTWILAFCEPALIPVLLRFCSASDGWTDEIADSYGSVVSYRPTHWMPLPALPGGETGT